MTEMTREQIIAAFTGTLDQLLHRANTLDQSGPCGIDRTGIADRVGHIRIPGDGNKLMEVQVCITGFMGDWIDRSMIVQYNPQYVIDNDEFFTDRQIRNAKKRL